jgi:2-(1,2-epoxy-1,2-dihydrophenyl)acetyl-CoA isomerase
MEFETIQLEMKGSVALLTLNRPEALNALTVTMGREIKVAIGRLAAEGARAVILAGAGRAFCAGGDLREMKSMAENEGRIEAFFDEPLRLLNECILLIRQTPVPFIAAVQGAASGGGCNLALSCDVVIAAKSAKFNQAFIKVGLSPDCGGTFILPRLIGWRRATELMMTGDLIGAEEAAAIGMINHVVSDEELQQHSFAFAERLAQAPTAAIGRIKQLLEQGANSDLESQLECERLAQIESGKTKDFREGVSAFIEKRMARFSGT